MTKQEKRNQIYPLTFKDHIKRWVRRPTIAYVVLVGAVCLGATCSLFKGLEYVVNKVDEIEKSYSPKELERIKDLNGDGIDDFIVSTPNKKFYFHSQENRTYLLKDVLKEENKE